MTILMSRIKDKANRTQRVFDKSIIALRIAMNKLSDLIDGTQSNSI
jgi:hypothetical protein